MIAHETAINQMTVKFKLLQVPLTPTIMSLYHNGSCKKLFINHDNRPNLLEMVNK